jgi:predicted component of type VI protein secretion system
MGSVFARGCCVSEPARGMLSFALFTGDATGPHVMDVKLVVTNHSQKMPQVIRLRSDDTIVGRQQGCDLRIPAPDVSRRHCRLSIRGDCLVVEDLASANGSFVNGARIQSEEIVRPGDLLGIGPVTFRVEYALSAAALQQMVPEAPVAEIAEEEVLASDEVEVVRLGGSDPPSSNEHHGTVVDASSGDGGDIPLAKEDGDQTVNLEDMAWKPPADVRDILSRLGEE